MTNSNAVEIFEKAPVPKAVLKNALPAMAAMLMVLIYNLADTFFIGQTHNDILVAAVSLATPRIPDFHGCRYSFRHGRHFGDFPRLGRGPDRVCEESLLFLYVGLHCCGDYNICSVFDFHGQHSCPGWS